LGGALGAEHADVAAGALDGDVVDSAVAGGVENTVCQVLLSVEVWIW